MKGHFQTKKALLLLTLLLLAGMLSACVLPGLGADAHPCLWKVTDPAGNSLYLFGTIHLGDERSEKALEKLSPILLDCDALAVEFDVIAYEQDPAASAGDYAQFLYADGSTIRDHMPEDTYRRCVELMKQADTYSPMLDRCNLAMWNQLTQQAVQMLHSPLDTEMGMDRLLIRLAYEHQLPVRNVESAQLQMGLISSFPDELNLLQIQELLESERFYGVALKRLYRIWLSGDSELLSSALGGGSEDSDTYTPEQQAMLAQYEHVMVEERNRGMAETALGYLAAGDTVFFAVGAGHMVGETGLVQLLRDAGCTVEPVDY